MQSQDNIVLVGNKCDNKGNIRVTKAKIEELRQKTNCLAYYETSARENINIDEVFFTVATAAFKVDAA